jgi:plasmid stability protein
MPTLYVENVPEDLYEALRARAQQDRRSIAAEVIEILRTSVPTEAEMERRREAIARILEIRSRPSPGKGPFPSAEEMIREDRER